MPASDPGVMTTLVTLLCLLFSLGHDVYAQRREPVTVDICAVLADPSKYDQQVLKIRGEFVHGTELHALEDRSCKDLLRTGEHVWPPRIWLTPPNRTATIPPGYKYDKASIDRFFEAIRNAESIHKRATIMVTYTGKIDARQSYSGGRVGEGRWIGNGFGHLNQCAAQLVYLSANEWDIVPQAEEGAKTNEP